MSPEFLLRFKIFLASIDVVPYDLPRELAEMRSNLEKFKSAQKLVDFKDQVIWKLAKTSKSEVHAHDEEADKEISEWEK